MNTDNFVNITEVWKASGLSYMRSPREWKRATKPKKDIAALAASLFVADDELVVDLKSPKRTLAHPDLIDSFKAFLALPLVGPRKQGPSRIEVIGDVALIELRDSSGGIAAHALIDAEDVGLVSSRRWSYSKTQVKGTNDVSLHRIILKAKVGDIVDHVNRNILDNRKINLRFTDAQGNARNRTTQSNNESGVHGVGWHKAAKMWNARITIDGKTMSLGYYKTIEEATKVRQEAERMYFGKFAPSHAPAGPSSQAILTRIIKMQALGFTFTPVPCGAHLCANFVHDGWGASGMAYNEDLTAAVFSASKAALLELAARKREHNRACKQAATVFTEYDPKRGLL